MEGFIFPTIEWALYARAGDFESGEGIALATQVEEMLSQAAGLGLSAEPKVAFIERWGGVDLDRPGLTELRRKVEAGEVRVVVAYSPAALAEKPTASDDAGERIPACGGAAALRSWEIGRRARGRRDTAFA